MAGSVCAGFCGSVSSWFSLSALGSVSGWFSLSAPGFVALCAAGSVCAGFHGFAGIV